MKNENYLKLWLLVFLFMFEASIYTELNAQVRTRKEFKDSLQTIPNFTINRDNYFIIGVPTNMAISSNTANAKYQISFKQIITHKNLPWNAYLFLAHKQKAFWNVYKELFTFRDINFNPKLTLNKLIFSSDDKLKDLAGLSFEPESIVRYNIFSRSWNRINLEYITSIGSKTIANLKVWLPFNHKNGENDDILDYVGIVKVNLSHEIKSCKLYVEVMLRKGCNGIGREYFDHVYTTTYSRTIQINILC
jgi:phospholipase A1